MHSNRKAYSGYYIDNDKLLQSSSGGAAYAFAERFIENNGVVFGVTFSNSYKSVEYCIVDKVEELFRIQGTKYCSAKKEINGVSIYELISNYLKKNTPVLVFGLGCDIASISSYCQKKLLDTSLLYLVDLICHGPVPNSILKSFIEELEEEYKSPIKSFQMRKKIKKWHPFYIYAIFENKQEFMARFEDTDFGIAFKRISKPQCTKCAFKGDNHKGDLCIGDFWGIKSSMKGWNQNGVSAIIVQTDKGLNLIKMLDDRFYLQEESCDFIIKHNMMYMKSRNSTVDYNGFMNDLNQRGLKYAVSKIPKEKEGIKTSFKKVLPKGFVTIIKKILRRSSDE